MAAGSVLTSPVTVTHLLNEIGPSLQLPQYLGRAGDIFPRIAAQVSTFRNAVNTLRMTFLEEHLVAAFPQTLSLLAAVGLFRLPRRWVDWSLALVAITSLQLVGMNAISGAPHPRLMYFAFPALYVLAAGALPACSTGSTARFCLSGLTRVLPRASPCCSSYSWLPRPSWRQTPLGGAIGPLMSAFTSSTCATDDTRSWRTVAPGLATGPRASRLPLLALGACTR